MNEKSKDFFLGVRKTLVKPASKTIISSLMSIFIGIIIGFILMLVTMAFTPDADPLTGLGTIFAGPFAGALPLLSFGNMLFYAVPLVFTGLSVAVAYKTGLFNIGAPGQFYMGSMCSLLIALNIDTTGNRVAGIFVWLLALIVGCLAGMLWGALVGIFKGFFNINEVIVCIMLNWIAANVVSWVFSLNPSIINSSSGKSGYLITTAVTGNGTPHIGLDKLFGQGSSNSLLDLSIIIAIIMCVLIWILLSKTTIGFSLKATGSNRNAARYAGINDKDRIIMSLTFAGGLAALGGAFYYLNPGIEFVWNSAYQNLPAYGFNGIPVALLANCNPFGVFFAALFVRYLTSAGSALTLAGYNKYLADIIIAVIIYLAGFTNFFKSLIDKFGKKKDEWYAKAGYYFMIIKDDDINAETPSEDAPKLDDKQIEEQYLNEIVEDVNSKPKKKNHLKTFFINVNDYFKYLNNKYIKRKKDPMSATLDPNYKEENEEKPSKEINEEGGNK